MNFYIRTADGDKVIVDRKLSVTDFFFLPVDYLEDPEDPGALRMFGGEVQVWDGSVWKGLGGISADGLGPGLTIIDDKLTLDLEALTLVSPIIAPLWTIYQNDGITPYSTPSSNSKNIVVDKGAKVDLSATYSYPAPGAGQAAPTSASGSFPGSLPSPGVNSDTLAVDDIAANASYNVTLSKPKSGLIVVNSQVQAASGNDTKTDSISASFMMKLYWGTTSKDGSSQPILDSDILSLQQEFRSNRLKSFTNFGGGGQRIIIVVQRGSGADNWGEAAFKVNGLANTAFTKVRSASSFVNAAGYGSPVDVWVSDNVYNSPLDNFEII